MTRALLLILATYASYLLQYTFGERPREHLREIEAAEKVLPPPREEPTSSVDEDERSPPRDKAIDKEAETPVSENEHGPESEDASSELVDDSPPPDDGKSVDEELSTLRKMFGKGGTVSIQLENVQKSNYNLNQAVVGWAEKPHQALVGIHHGLIGAANGAQSVLFGDALRLDQALRQNLKNETSKMDLIALDPQSRFKVLKERGTMRIMPPPGPYDRLIGKRVLCDGYDGDNMEDVNNKAGEVINFDDRLHKYNIRMEGKDMVVALTMQQFKTIGNAAVDSVHQNRTVENSTGSHEQSDEESEQSNNTAAPDTGPKDARWCTDALKKEVRIDHLPATMIEDMANAGVPIDALMFQLGTVTRCFPGGGQPQFEIQLDNDQYGFFENMGEWPQLVYNRDFHFVEDLEGKKVVVTRPHYGIPGTKTYIPAIKAEGTVLGYDDGLYRVKIPEHTVDVSPNEVQRAKYKFGEEIYEEAPDSLVGNSVSFKDEISGHQLEGKIFAVNGEGEDATYSVEVDGASYHKRLNREDFLVLQSPSAREMMNPSGFELVGEPVTYEDESGTRKLAIVTKVLSGPPYSYVVESEDLDQSERMERELTLVKNDAILGLEVQFRKPDGRLMTGILVKIDEKTDPDLNIYWAMDPEAKAYRLLFRDFKALNFKADENYQRTDRPLPVGPELVGETVEYIDDSGNVKKGKVSSCSPEEASQDASAYTYTIQGIPEASRPEETAKHSQLIRCIPRPSEDEGLRAASEKPTEQVSQVASVASEVSELPSQEVSQVASQEVSSQEVSQVASVDSRVGGGKTIPVVGRIPAVSPEILQARHVQLRRAREQDEDASSETRPPSWEDGSSRDQS